MKSLLILLLTINIPFWVNGQNIVVKQSKDSLQKNLTSVSRTKIDSLNKKVIAELFNEKNAISSKIITSKSSLNQDSIKQTANTKIEATKKELANKLSVKGKDSIAKSKIYDLKEKTNIDSLKKQASVKLKSEIKKKTKLEFNGFINAESNFSSIPAPFSQYKNNYQRVTLDLGINLFGIPLRTEGNWGNDNSLFYPSNSFKLYFDANLFNKPENIGKGIAEKAEQYKSDYILKLKAKVQTPM